MNILHEVPESKEYMALRVAVGNSSMEDSVAKTALSNSIFSVIVRGNDSELIGMARIIGDGGYFFQIVDIAVNPSHGNKELVKVMMNEITAYINQNAPKGANVILMADVPSFSLYQTYGFDYTYPQSISLCKSL